METYNLYKISCYSSCGTYFGQYLQYLQLFAKDEDDAIDTVNKWMEETKNNFIYPMYRHVKKSGKEITIKAWEIDVLFVGLTGIEKSVVIEDHYDSDY